MLDSVAFTAAPMQPVRHIFGTRGLLAQRGANRWDAAVQAARTRLRPILMTSIAFILGVLPLMIAAGAGSELRRPLGTAVFFGMLGVTLFGLLFTPMFFVLVRWLGTLRSRAIPAASEFVYSSDTHECAEEGPGERVNKLKYLD